MALMSEIWKDVLGYEGFYQISNFGNAKSLPRKKTNGVNLSPGSQISGHLAVSFSKQGVVKKFLLHRLVAQAFVEGFFEGAEVRHLDGNPKNNNFKNLAWGTRSDNRKDMYHAHGKRVGTKSHFAKYTEEQIAFVISLKDTMSSKSAESVTGISRRYISQLWIGDTGRGRHASYSKEAVDEWLATL